MTSSSLCETFTSTDFIIRGAQEEDQPRALMQPDETSLDSNATHAAKRDISNGSAQRIQRDRQRTECPQDQAFEEKNSIQGQVVLASQHNVSQRRPRRKQLGNLRKTHQRSKLEERFTTPMPQPKKNKRGGYCFQG